MLWGWVSSQVLKPDPNFNMWLNFRASSGLKAGRGPRPANGSPVRMCMPLQGFSKRLVGENQHQVVSFSCLQKKKGWVSWLVCLSRILHSSQFSGGGKCITLNVNYSLLLHFPQTTALSFLEGPNLTARRPEGELMWFPWTSELWCSCSCVESRGFRRATDRRRPWWHLCAEG